MLFSPFIESSRKVVGHVILPITNFPFANEPQIRGFQVAGAERLFQDGFQIDSSIGLHVLEGEMVAEFVDLGVS